MDLHISVVEDFKATHPDIEIVDWSLSTDHWLMNKPQQQPAHIHPKSWERLDLDMIAAFQKEYDEFLSSFDGFLVCHVTAFAMIYEKYNKPVVMLNSCRYDMPFCWSNNLKMIDLLNQCLHRLSARGLLVPVSNNKADQLYTYLGSGIRTYHIPSLCLYTGMRYNPTKSTFLCFHGPRIEHPLVKHKKGWFDWKDIGTYRGVIHFPYEVSTMSMFEHYSAGMPMFFPSKSYWKSQMNLQSISVYWKVLPPRYSALRDTARWIDLSDIYQVFKSPNIYYFDSISHLISLLESFVYVDDTAQRKHHIDHTRLAWLAVLDQQNAFRNRNTNPA